MNLRPLLLPFSFLYASIARLRNLFFVTGIWKEKKFDIPVILVGNLSTGGTGKTPHVEYLLDLLHKDFRLATLSRGYGRKSNGFVVAGKGVDADMIGDEPMQYFSRYENVTVAVCEKRAEGIEKLMAADKNLQVIIMDDGYQHRQVNPGFKILLTSIDKLYTRDFVLPAGDLREPRSAYRRADCIVVTRCHENMTLNEKEQLKAEIRPLKHQRLFFSSLNYKDLSAFFSHQTLKLEELKSRKVVLFTGIAHPEHLHDLVMKNAAAVKLVRFADHHEYNRKDIALLKEKFDKFADASAILVTTEKDYQRLRNTPFMKELESLPCYFIPIKVHLHQHEEFNQTIRNYVEKNKRDR